MKHIKAYKVFESNSGSGNTSFNFLIKKNNEDYLKLEEILEVDLFDEFRITRRSDDFFNEDHWPTHKFWTYRLSGAPSVEEDTAEFEEIPEGKKIASIIIFNIDHKEHDQFVENLKEIKVSIKSYTGKELVWGSETIESSPGSEIYDFILKLV